MTSFTNKKALKFEIVIGTGAFSGGGNKITIQGKRAMAHIEHAGGKQIGTLRATIYGVTQSDMNAITTLSWDPKRLGIAHINQNTITVHAIDGDRDSVVFYGNIINAWGEYQSMPDVYLHIQASISIYQQMTPIKPRFRKAPVDVASVLSEIAKDMNMKPENNGVNLTLGKQYLNGTNMDQVYQIRDHANIDIYFDYNILAFCPKGQSRNKFVTVISSQTGMKGYPTFDAARINVITLYRPDIIPGCPIQVITDVTRAAGNWKADILTHDLESEMPEGKWFTRIVGYKILQ